METIYHSKTEDGKNKLRRNTQSHKNKAKKRET